MDEKKKNNEVFQMLVTILICGGIAIGTLSMFMGWEAIGITSGIMAGIGLAIMFCSIGSDVMK